jgi:hypothetical protein
MVLIWRVFVPDFLLFGFFLGGALFYTFCVHGLYPFGGFSNNLFAYKKKGNISLGVDAFKTVSFFMRVSPWNITHFLTIWNNSLLCHAFVCCLFSLNINLCVVWWD